MLASFTSLYLALMELGSLLVSFAPPPRLVYQFPKDTQIENLAVRPSGDLLLSAISKPVLYTIDTTASTPYAEIVHTFPNATGLSGVTELNTPDVFAVVAGNWNYNFTGQKGSFNVWRVDFRSDPPIVDLIAPIPEGDTLNGIAVVQDKSDTILVADSQLGAVWALDPNSHRKEATIAIRDKMFELDPKENFTLGINGINTRVDDRGRHFLHFTNSARNLYGIVPIKTDGSATGKARRIATLDLPARYDDFAIDPNGNALLATHQNAVYRVSLDGTAILWSKSSLIKQPTSSIFGRGSRKEEYTLYLSTIGSPNGGQVIAIDDYTYIGKATAATRSPSFRVQQRVFGL